MPDNYTHRTVTSHAVKLTNFPDAEKLIETYSLYPDLYYGKDKNAIAPYLFMDGDVGFHDIPASSITELYQFWIPDENGLLHRGRKYSNTAYLFCEKCFTFYFENIKKAISEKRFDDVMKFTGCLIHHMQDATFGLHVLEGAAGADVYTLNKLSGVDFMSYFFELKLKDEWQQQVINPVYLGDTPVEAVMQLCTQYINHNKKSCNALFAIAANRISKNDSSILENETLNMYKSSVEITSAILHTVNSWQQNSPQNSTNSEVFLADIAPYEAPLGGTGSYRIKMLQINGTELEFGVHFEQNLIYHIACDTFCMLTAEIFTKDTNEVNVNLINNNEIIDSFILQKNEIKQIKINNPCGVFGLRTSSAHPAGALFVKNAKLKRKGHSV